MKNEVILSFIITVVCLVSVGESDGAFRRCYSRPVCFTSQRDNRSSVPHTRGRRRHCQRD